MLTRYKKARLIDALVECYPGERIVGYVVDARVCCVSLIGSLYASSSQPNGSDLRSEEITEVFQYKKRWLVTTRTGCFVVVNFHRQGGRQSLEFLIALFQSHKFSQSTRRRH